MIKLSLCITNYNRYELLLNSFKRVLGHGMIDEVVIVDDCSDIEIYEKLKSILPKLPHGEKIKLFRNEVNLGMARNKLEAVRKAKNDWCILFDSDNTLDIDYLDALEKVSQANALDEQRIYMPDFARPRFDFKKLSAYVITKGNIKGLFKDHRIMGALMNTCNYVVHRERYMKTWEANAEIKGTDTIWFAYLWLKAGGSFYVVRGMQYEHLVHDGSEFLKNTDYNMAMAGKMEKLITAIG